MRDKGGRLRILYLGPCNSDLALQGDHAASLSATKWSRGLLHALRDMADIVVVTHIVERCWPKGRFLWGSADSALYDSSMEVHPIGYPTLPFIGDFWLTASYVSKVRKMVSEHKVDVVLCYNCMQPYHIAAMREAQRLGVPTVPIILDGDDPRPDNWGKLLEETRYASGIAMLSWWIYEKFPTSCPKLHLDGGADGWKGGQMLQPRKEGPFRVVYTGALARWSGADFLLDIVEKCNRPDVRFIVCGKVEPGEADALSQCPNVELRGYVSERELQEICEDADAFLNIRDPRLGDNILNYPSKLPQYMAYGKPVVSNRLSSLAPDYDRLLFVDDSSSPEGFLAKLDDALAETEHARLQRFTDIHNWFVSKKTWQVQAARLLEFLKGLAGETACLDR